MSADDMIFSIEESHALSAALGKLNQQNDTLVETNRLLAAQNKDLQSAWGQITVLADLVSQLKTEIDTDNRRKRESIEQLYMSNLQVCVDPLTCLPTTT